MAEDGVFPACFRMQGDAPGAAVALQVVLAVIVIWITTLQELLSYLGFLLSLSAATTVASLFVLRRREGAEQVPITGYPVVPGLFVLCTLSFAGLAAFRRPLELVAGLTALALGVVLYLLRSRRRQTQGTKGDEGAGLRR